MNVDFDVLSSAIINAQQNITGESFTTETYQMFEPQILSMAQTLEDGTGIPSSAFIPYVTKLVSLIRIPAYNNMDVKYNVPYGENDADKQGNVDVPYRNNLFSQAIIEPAKYDGFSGRAFNPYIEHFPGSARITENLSLDIKIGILSPPINELYVSVLKDTYTRQAKPTINYGSSHTMVSGKATDGQYITYLEFDLKPIIAQVDNEMNFLSIKLQINKLYSTDGKLNIYECYSPWGENYLIWLNSMYLSPSPIATAQATGEQVNVDLKKFILEAIASGKTKLSLAIKSTDFVIMNTRESGSPAKLVGRYIDPNWSGFIDKLDLISSAIIRRVANKDLNGSYRLVQKLFQTAKAELRDPTMQYSKAEINQPNIYCSADIVGSSYFPASAIVRQTIDEKIKSLLECDLVGRADHNRINKSSSVKIPYRNDINSVAIIPPDESYSEIDSQVHIARDFVESLVEIVKSLYGTGKAIVRRKDKDDFTGYVEALNMYLIGKSRIRNATWLNGETVFRRKYDAADPLGQAELAKFQLTSQFRLKKGTDQHGSAIVKVNKFEFPGETEVVHASIFGKVGVGHISELASKAAMNIPLYLNGQAIVRLSADDNFNSEVTARRVDLLDTIGQGLIPLYDYNPQGTVVVRQVADKDSIDTAIIRRTEVTAIPSVADLYKPFDMGGRVEAYQVSNCRSEAVIRQFDVTQTEWQAWVANGWWHDMWKSNVDIRITTTHLTAFAHVNTPARRWIPSNHRKLPRVWKREDFINE